MKKSSAKYNPELLNEYDFIKGVRGKYTRRYAAGTNVVVLLPGIAEIFPDSKSVNDALGILIRITQQQLKTKAKPS